MSRTPSAPASWESQGCAVCRRQWETAERPHFVAENVADRSELYRCTVCGALWLMTERAASVVQPEAIRSTYPGVVESAGRRPSGSEARASDDEVQYWRHSVASTDHYFGLVNGRDFILRGDQWVPYDVYKSGPSWWRLTGEPGADVITQDDLPPDAPRGVQGR